LNLMKRIIRIVLGLAIALGGLNAHAQRAFNQAELDALLAPIALYPDPLLNEVLDASRYPDDVAAAAAWSRSNPQVQGDAALAAVENAPWPPSVKALVASPDVLARMMESPQWLADLGDAYANYQPYVQATIQELRQRAETNGYLQSDNQQQVYQQSGQIVVQPIYPNVIYAPYYDPYVVYGTWWWPAYRPVRFRPFYARPVIVTRIVQPVRFVNRVHVTPYHAVPESQRQPIIHGTPPARFIAHAPATQSAAPTRFMPQARYRMPAPQVRASERPMTHTAPAQAQGSHSGWKHRG